MTDLLNEAIKQHQAGNLRDAEQLYRADLRLHPNHLDSLALLGVTLSALGQHDEAIALTRKAAHGDPKSALFEFHCGSVLMNAKQMPKAIIAFRQATLLNPLMAQAHFNLANALRASGEWAEAINSYKKAIKVFPNFAEGYNNLALSLVHEKRFAEALDSAKKSVEIDPQYGEGWRTLCNIAEQAQDYNLAEAAGIRCIELMPTNHFAWFGYGVALCRLNRYAEAVPVYQRALELKPDRADIWDNLGQTFQSLNRLDEAEATFRKTVEVAGQTIANEFSRDIREEEFGNRHWHLALMELLRGKYKAGFSRYRARFEDVGGLKRPTFSRPLWQGEPLQDKTILITDEQGFGDTLMLCRYLPLLKQQGAKIKFSVHPALEPLFRGWPVIDQLLVHGSTVTDYDFYTSVFDLPYRMGTTLETIPHEVPYLPAPQPTAFHIGSDGRKKIGVVWGGSPLHTNDVKRSVPLSIFSALFNQTNAQFLSLNRDMKDGDASVLPTLPILNCGPLIQNFNDGAAIINQMDLIITCDTATAHLAGGLGKPVWILLPFAPDWRWLTERSDSPWYPTARLFRQPQIGNWKAVIGDVRHALQTFCAR